jgi:hypothetical protein
MKAITCLSFLVVAPGVGFAAEQDDPKSPAAWSKVDEGKTGLRQGSVLVHVPELKQMLLVGLARDAPFVQAFDPESKRWTAYSEAQPFKSDFNNPNKQPDFSYQAAYDPGSRAVYFLSSGNVLYAFDTVRKTWKSYPPAPELDGLAWPALACDPLGKRIVVVGAEKKGNAPGWSRTVVYDIPGGKWQRLEPADKEVLQEHRSLVAATEALIDLGGSMRLAWYRDPGGVGSDAERAVLCERCAEARKLPGMAGMNEELDRVLALLKGKKTLEALHAVRQCQRKVEERAEAQYPVPCSRRNSPLVFDPANRVFVLFGGDHQDYLMNDTWVLDLDRKGWRRVRPERCPTPRAGHALVYLPGCGKVALYEGYVQSASTDYAAIPWSSITPVQLWLYDVKANRWDLAGSWSPPEKKDTGDTIAPVAYFYGGEGNNRFAAPALAADPANRLVLAGTDTQKIHWCRWRRPAATWILPLDPARVDEAGAARFGTAANQRLYRPGLFRAEFCEVAESAPETGIDRLRANRWVKLPAAPRNPAHGCRARDWSTSVWDSDRDQILLWGGGHCVRSSSTVLHYSPVSGRVVEGFDADESYGHNSPADGTLAHDSSLLGRPWVSVHNYKHYAYDPRCRLLVSGRGYLYDPERMDWLRLEKQELPYPFRWGATVLAASRHGAVAWASKQNGEDAGLWLFDRQKGWLDLAPKGKLFVPWCDTHGMVYDSKRDRMVMSGVGGGYAKTSDGTFLTFDFATKKLELLVPGNADLGKTAGCTREVVYVEHADWILLGHNLRVGDPKTGKSYTRVYDCGRNKLFLLDAGPVPDGHEAGWMYDARRKLVYSFTTHGETWALKLDPASAALLEKVD